MDTYDGMIRLCAAAIAALIVWFGIALIVLAIGPMIPIVGPEAVENVETISFLGGAIAWIEGLVRPKSW